MADSDPRGTDLADAVETADDFVARRLRELGVAKVFGLVGEDTVTFAAALGAAGLEYVGARHEAAAAGMADGYAWARGEVGVCAVTRGAGLSNALTMLRTAVRHRSRLLVITGEVITGEEDGSYIKDLDQTGVTRAAGLEYFAVRDRADLPAQLAAAFASAANGRPAVLGVPADIFHAPMSGGMEPGPVEFPVRVGRGGPPHEDEVALLAELLRSAKRPLILAGRGGVGARESLIALAERAGALLGTTLPAKGLFAGSPYNLGLVGGYASDSAHKELGDVDLVVAFGASLTFFTLGHGTLFRDAKIAQVYTDSPLVTYRAPVDLGIVADADLTAKALLAAIDDAPAPVDPLFHHPEVLERIAGPASLTVDEDAEDRLAPRTVTTVLNEILPPDRTIVFDAGRFVCAVARFVEVPAYGHLRQTVDGGSIGLGLGVAMGVALARPGQPTALFIGDGGLSMSIGDLATVSQLGIGLVIIVLDDMAYGSEIGVLKAAGLSDEHAALPPIDFAGVARAFGVEAETVRTVEELRALAPRLVDRDRPLLVHCPTRRELPVPFMKW